jgi:flagellar biosynthetic protein FliR
METLRIEVATLMAGLLLSLRLGMVLFLTPILGGMSLPARVKVMTIFALSMWLVPALQPELESATLALHSMPAFVLAMLAEVVWGLLLSFGLAAAFAAFLVGGRLLELQMGLGVATLFDPATRSQMPLLGVLLQMMGVAAFLSVDGHHMVLRALAASLQTLPLGSLPLAVPMQAVLAQFGLSFSLGLLLVSAALACCLLIDVAMSVAARLLPQANVLFISIPVKVLAGLATLALSAPLLRPLLSRLYLSTFHYWDSLLQR